MKKLWAALFLLCMLGLGSVTAWAQASGQTWTDPRTGLMWTRDTNRRDVTWYQARNFCGHLKLAGFSNWRLATIEELAGIYDDFQGRIKGGIRLSACCAWSSTTTNASHEAWGFDFFEGVRYFNALHTSYNDRTLCVRR